MADLRVVSRRQFPLWRRSDGDPPAVSGARRDLWSARAGGSRPWAPARRAGLSRFSGRLSLPGVQHARGWKEFSDFRSLHQGRHLAAGRFRPPDQLGGPAAAEEIAIPILCSPGYSTLLAASRKHWRPTLRPVEYTRVPLRSWIVGHPEVGPPLRRSLPTSRAALNRRGAGACMQDRGCETAFLEAGPTGFPHAGSMDGNATRPELA